MSHAGVKVSAKGLIFHQGKFLVIRERLDEQMVWDLPGGKVDYGEKPVETLHREVFEELQLQVKDPELIGVAHFETIEHQNWIVCLLYKCQLEGDSQIDTTKNPAQEDIMQWKWLSWDEFQKDDEIELEESFVEVIKSVMAK